MYGTVNSRILPSCVPFGIFIHNLTARIEKTHENRKLYHSSSSYKHREEMKKDSKDYEHKVNTILHFKIQGRNINPDILIYLFS